MTSQQHNNQPAEGATLPPNLPREYLLSKRQALLIELGAIERALGVPRTVPPRHERDRLYFERRRGGEGEG